jgi:hypothetical protein
MSGYKGGGGLITITSFNPVSLITGSGGFWRADMGVTTSGGNVTSWADQSSFNSTMTSIGSGNPPWSATGFNSAYPGVSGTGQAAGVNRLETAAASFPLTTTISAFELIFINSTHSGNGSRIMLFMTQTGMDVLTGNSGGFVTDAGWYVSGIGPVGDGSYSLSTPYLMALTYDGTNFRAYLNGVLQTTTNAASLTLGNSSTGVMGLVGGTTGAGLDGTIGFAGITQKVLTPTDLANLNAFSNANWGTSF